MTQRRKKEYTLEKTLVEIVFGGILAYIAYAIEFLG